jgi:aldose 1-epimerase
MSVAIRSFGTSSANIYKLTNENGYELSTTNLGATITGFLVPDNKGGKTDVVLGYATYNGYMKGTAYMGATVGRVANRIADGEFHLNEKTYRLDKNSGRNTLHGGFDSWHTRIWDAQINDEPNSITFSLTSHHGDQGMPGNARINVTYTLTENNAITITYRAVADKDTVFNLTNHVYFNLDGYDADKIANQYLWINADYFTPVNEELLPSGEIRSVKGTPFDFTNPKPIGKDIAVKDPQILIGRGYDHNYVLNQREPNEPFAKAISGKTRISLTAYTDMPGVQFYTGNSIGNDSETKGRHKFARQGGFCLETQYFPDSPHHDNFPSIVYRAGRNFESTTIYKFAVE